MDLLWNGYDGVAEDCCSAAENFRPCDAPVAPIICLGTMQAHQEDELKDGSHAVQLGILGGLHEISSQAST